MARGWESKSVELQQEEAAVDLTSERPRLTPEQAHRLRERESLRLSLRSVVEQLERAGDPRRRAMLEQAKAHLEQRIEKLGA